MKLSSVTAQAVERLEQERPVPEFSLDFTIGGMVETEVHSAFAAEREQAISHGHARLNGASERFEAAMAQATAPHVTNQNMRELKERAMARRDQQRSISQSFSHVHGLDV